MKDKFSLQYSFDLILAVVAIIGAILVLQTFIIGKHYIIPTMILFVTLLTGNLAWYGLKNKLWAKYLLFWAGFLATSHFLFALFWSKRYREILGSAFEPSCAILVIILAYLTYQYARKNAIFK